MLIINYTFSVFKFESFKYYSPSLFVSKSTIWMNKTNKKQNDSRRGKTVRGREAFKKRLTKKERSINKQQKYLCQLQRTAIVHNQIENQPRFDDTLSSPARNNPPIFLRIFLRIIIHHSSFHRYPRTKWTRSGTFITQRWPAPVISRFRTKRGKFRAPFWILIRFPPLQSIPPSRLSQLCFSREDPPLLFSLSRVSTVDSKASRVR